MAERVGTGTKPGGLGDEVADVGEELVEAGLRGEEARADGRGEGVVAGEGCGVGGVAQEEALAGVRTHTERERERESTR